MLVATSPRSILTAAECAQERTPRELAEWVARKNESFGRSAEGRSYITSRRGLARRFVDEVCPLSFLSQHLFYRRRDVVCKLDFEGYGYHATVVDYRDRPVRVHKLLFRHAISNYAHYLRTAYWSQFARVPGLRRRATRGDRLMANDNQVNAPASESLDQGLRLIMRTAQAESARACINDCSLVIVFDDYHLFRLPANLSMMAEFVEADVLPMALGFSKLFLLGWSGSMLLGFALADRPA